MSDTSLKLRRVVTGQNADGRSCVFIDGPPAEVLAFSEQAGLHEIWTLAPGPLRRTEEVDHGKGKVALSPPPQGVKLRWFTVAPTPEGGAPEEAEKRYSEIFDMMQGGDTRPDTSRHPGMHLTKTIDFIILVRGKVRLLLDDDERVLSPGDVVVQRGTNHAWTCEGEEPALLVAVLIDRDFAD